MFKNHIDKLKNEIVSSTCELIKIPSVNKESTSESMPFGEECNNALEYVLDLANNLGFKTKNIDGYCGYVEFGEGEELMGIIGHLDVVPEGENWTYPPFSGTVSNGKIYGRGAIDDKGPVIASLYAMKVVMDNCKIKKRVRLILGLNEEKDWKCIEYYKLHEEIPSFGFSPDADFPCIYAEKSLLNVHLISNYKANDKIKIINIDYNDNAMNVVPKFCRIMLNIDNTIDIDECIINLTILSKKHNFNTTVMKDNDNNIIIESFGISAHSAHPDLGINAISNIIIILNELLKIYNINIELLSMFCRYIHTQYNGDDLNINFPDESGKLTLNVARFFLQDNTLGISMNLRIPINTSIDKIKNSFNNLFENTSIIVDFDGEKPSLYIPKDNYLVTTLCSIFNEMVDKNEEPISIGGATYARAFKNFVSFGANMPNEEDMCHKVDEFISINNLILATNIYATAIYKLCS